MEETLPPESQGDTDSIIDDLCNQLEIEGDDCDFEKIVYHYSNNGDLFLNFGCVGDTLGEDNIIEVSFRILKKYPPIEL